MDSPKNLFSSSLRSHLDVMNQLDIFVPILSKIAMQMAQAIENGGKIFWMGNGGSAADSQHLAAELIGRFKEERRAIASIALTTDSSVLTCLSNDYDFSIVFSRQIEALAKKGDVVIGISTSGNSKNVIKGMEAAKKAGALTIGFAGLGPHLLEKTADFCISVPSKITARIQEAHIFMGHCLCEWVEREVVREHQLTAKETV